MDSNKFICIMCKRVLDEIKRFNNTNICYECAGDIANTYNDQHKFNTDKKERIEILNVIQNTLDKWNVCPRCNGRRTIIRDRLPGFWAMLRGDTAKDWQETLRCPICDGTGKI